MDVVCLPQVTLLRGVGASTPFGIPGKPWELYSSTFTHCGHAGTVSFTGDFLHFVYSWNSNLFSFSSCQCMCLVQDEREERLLFLVQGGQSCHSVLEITEFFKQHPHLLVKSDAVQHTWAVPSPYCSCVGFFVTISESVSTSPCPIIKSQIDNASLLCSQIWAYGELPDCSLSCKTVKLSLCECSCGGVCVCMHTCLSNLFFFLKDVKLSAAVQ